MNTIFSSLSKGISGLKASEIQIATAGNNIANAHSTFYTRQRAIQTTASFYNIGNGIELGMGTNIDSIVRLHDEYSYHKLKTVSTQLEYTGYSKSKLEEIAKRFPDTKDNGILKDLENYHDSWNKFSTSANDGAVKQGLITSAKSLSEHINNAYADLVKIEEAINDDIRLTVEEINRIGEQIANINKQIPKQEVLVTDRANELRDRRDELELTLSKLVGTVASKFIINQESRLDQTMTDGGKYYNLTIQGHEIVSGPNFTPIKLMLDEATGVYSIVYQGVDETITDLTTQLTGGKLAAQLDLRGRTYSREYGGYEDGIIQDYKGMLNTFAKTMMTQTNNIYASSAKSTMSSDPMIGLREDTKLMNYDKNIQIGSFDLILYDEKGVRINSKTINVDVNTTMEDIIRQITANTDDNNNNNNIDDIDDYLSATFDYDSRTQSGMIQLSVATPNYKIAIEDKGTNFAGVLNLGGFFSGTNATTMRVKSELLEDPNLLRASRNGNDGDNEIANAILQLQYDEVNFYNKDGTVDTKALDGYYRLFTGKIASQTQANNITHDTNSTLYNSVYEEFQSLNGVNANEELANLIQFQASYGAASKVVTTVDQMINTLLSLKQ